MLSVGHPSFAESANGEIVGLRAAGSEDDLIRFGADEGRDFATRPIDRGACLLAKTVNTRRISIRFRQGSGHRCGDARVDRRRGAVIQVNSTVRSHFRVA